MGKKPVQLSPAGSPFRCLKLIVNTTVLTSSAFVMALAMGGQHTPLALLSLIPLIRGIQVLSPKAAVVRGGAWGGLLWLFMGGYSSASLALLALPLLVTLFAAYAGAGAWITRRVGFSPLLLAIGWFFLEIAIRPLAIQQGMLGASGGVITGTVAHSLGYAWVAFLFVFLFAWVMSVINRVRFELTHTPLVAGLDIAGRGLWNLIPALMPRHAAVPSSPRAPPLAR